MVSVDDSEVAKRFRKISSDPRASGGTMPYFIVKYSDRWSPLVRECNHRRIIEVYDEIIESTDRLVSELFAMDEVELYCLCSLENELSGQRGGNMSLDEALKTAQQANISDFPGLEEDINRLPEENINRRRFPTAIMHALMDHALYFKNLWGENQETLDMKRPQEILLRLGEKYQYRAVFTALATFSSGEIVTVDSPGGKV